MEASENVRLHIELSDHPVEVQTGFQGNGHGEGHEEEGWCKVAPVLERTDARYILFLACDITPRRKYRSCRLLQILYFRRKQKVWRFYTPPPPPQFILVHFIYLDGLMK